MREGSERRGLAERFAARERHARQQGIAEHVLEDRLRIHLQAAREVVRLGILAARTMVRAALCEDRIADSRPVDDGIRYRSCELNRCHA